MLSKVALAFAIGVPVMMMLYRFWMLGFTLSSWDEGDIQDLTGKIAIVTGANMGLGFETARQMAEHGAKVVLGCRSMAKCEDAKSRILKGKASAEVMAMLLDLSEPESVEKFVEEFKGKFSSLDYLINNAGIMGTHFGRNSKGWENQIATNHLGHFILTGRLMDLLKKSKGRVVNHSSAYAAQAIIYGAQRNSAHPGSKAMPMVNLTDWNWQEHDYCPWGAYAQSKRANLYFTYELNRRYAAQGVTAAACHPGGSATGLQSKVDSEISVMVDMLNSQTVRSVMFSKPKDGALPQTYAALVAKPGRNSLNPIL